MSNAVLEAQDFRVKKKKQITSATMEFMYSNTGGRHQHIGAQGVLTVLWFWIISRFHCEGGPMQRKWAKQILGESIPAGGNNKYKESQGVWLWSGPHISVGERGWTPQAPKWPEETEQEKMRGMQNSEWIHCAGPVHLCKDFCLYSTSHRKLSEDSKKRKNITASKIRLDNNKEVQILLTNSLQVLLLSPFDIWMCGPKCNIEYVAGPGCEPRQPGSGVCAPNFHVASPPLTLKFNRTILVSLKEVKAKLGSFVKGVFIAIF